MRTQIRKRRVYKGKVYVDPFPVEKLKRVDRPTTLIMEDRVQRVVEIEISTHNRHGHSASVFDFFCDRHVFCPLLFLRDEDLWRSFAGPLDPNLSIHIRSGGWLRHDEQRAFL